MYTFSLQLGTFANNPTTIDRIIILLMRLHLWIMYVRMQYLHIWIYICKCQINKPIYKCEYCDQIWVGRKPGLNAFFREESYKIRVYLPQEWEIQCGK